MPNGAQDSISHSSIYNSDRKNLIGSFGTKLEILAFKRANIIRGKIETGIIVNVL